MLFYFFRGIIACFRGITARFRGINASLRGILTFFRGITAHFRGIPTLLPRNHTLPQAWHYYLIAFIEACLYNVFLGAKPTWHGRNIRVTPKNAITARICWAFFVL